MRYARWLSEAALQEFKSGRLKFLLAGVGTWRPGDRHAFDIQIREGDRLMFYHGTTKLLDVTLDMTRQEVIFTAANAYAQASCYAELMKAWSLAEVESLQEIVLGYLNSAADIAGDQYYRNRREGFWQNRLAIAFGPDWSPGMDWLVVDREAVVGFNNDAERTAVVAPIQQKFQQVKDQLRSEDPGLWGQPDDANLGMECDFLALGPSGELHCIELKHGSNASGVYWGSLQSAVYRDIFQATKSAITEGIKTLVRQKVELGLLPELALKRLPNEGFRGVQAVLAVAEPNDLSSCWKRLAEVMDRCPEAEIAVVEFRNEEDMAMVVRPKQR